MVSLEKEYQATVLEIPCPICLGEGGEKKDGKFISICWKCSGDGVVASEFGMRILAFIERHKRIED
jgi:DnaJ-class molecular chaperone